MSYKTYYNLASLILVVFCLTLVALITYPFLEAESATKIQKQALENQIKLRDELRLHRDLYMRVATSTNPVIQDDIRQACKTNITELNSKIYSNHNVSPEEEIELRKKIKEVNVMLSEKLHLESIPMSSE